ncbi:hypothetical protein [Roseovarius sp. EL26]|uniref:hypothetical protein n=1 Tax=Roseovarius sp. EL26 TaxID=2126672 RepID=UPI0013C47B0A|nr:hypothetical protein [Roseovarius sp. EL26]
MTKYGCRRTSTTEQNLEHKEFGADVTVLEECPYSKRSGELSVFANRGSGSSLAAFPPVDSSIQV